MTKDPLQFRLDHDYHGFTLVCKLCDREELFDLCCDDIDNNTITLNDLLLWGWKHECDE